MNRDPYASFLSSLLRHHHLLHRPVPISAGDADDTAATIRILVAVGSVNGVAIVGKTNEWRMLIRIDRVEAVGIVQVTNIGYHFQVQLKSGRVLVVAVGVPVLG